jgi:sporulation protein YlmC with PRC-barrel domain
MTQHSDDHAAAPMLRRLTDLRDFTIGAADGDIGTVTDVYFDDVSWTVRYLVVDTGSWLSGRSVLLSPASLRGFEAAGRRVRTELTRRQVQDSPSIDTQKPVSRQHETEFLSYYGYEPYWGGPYRWGSYAYPYPVEGMMPPIAETRRESRVAEELAAREREHRDEHLHSARAVTGYGIRATDGELGHVEDFLIDEQDWAIRYLIVDPRNWWPGPHVLVASDWICGVTWSDSTVEVDVSREAVRNAPRYEASRPFGRDEESRLYGHHGRPGYWDRRPEAGRSYPPAA